MAERKRRKKNKLRGKRTHGKGDTKNRRGAGSRGGVGRAGSHKHKYSLYYDDFGKGKKLHSKKKTNAINLSDLMQKIPMFVESKKVEKQGSSFIIDGKKIKYGKILGKGVLDKALIVRNMQVSKSASEKITGAKGKIEGAMGTNKKDAGQQSEDVKSTEKENIDAKTEETGNGSEKEL